MAETNSKAGLGKEGKVKGKIGYIGVDVLHNATICNEASGLLAQGFPLEICSVHPIEAPGYYRQESMALLRQKTTALYPLKPLETAQAIFLGPFLFGLNWFRAIWGAFSCPAESWGARFRLLAHLIPALVLALRWRGQDIRHIHAQWAHTATTIAMHAATLLGIGFSFTGHANDLFVHRVGLKGKLLRARFAVGISAWHKNLFEQIGCRPGRVPIVYCGIDSKRFAPTEPASGGASHGRLPQEPPRFVGVGRLVPKKGFDDLVRACRLLKDRGVAFHCLIAGSGPEEKALREQIRAADLEKEVEVTGKPVLQEELPEMLRQSRASVLPCVKDNEGDMDGLPQVLIEAMACGVPVISTVLVGIPDLVRPGLDGLLVPTRDVEALAKAMTTLAQSPELAHAMGQYARVRAEAYFDRSEYLKRLTTLFCEALEDPGPDGKVTPFEAAPLTAREGEKVLL